MTIKPALIIATCLVVTSALSFTEKDIPELKVTALDCLENTVQSGVVDEGLDLAIENFVCTIDPKSHRKIKLKQLIQDAQKDIDQKLVQKDTMEDPVISFVLPVYNRAEVVRESIDSIYAQGITVPFEVIAVDDASTDSSAAILAEYEQRYHNFFFYQNEVNKKSPATRNIGMAHARGDLLFNLDSDDVLEPGLFNKLFDLFQASGCDTAMFDQLWYVNDFSKNIYAREIFHGVNKVHHTCDPIGPSVILISINNRIMTKKSWLRAGGYLDMRGHDGFSFGLSQVATGTSYALLPNSGYWHRTWTNASKSMYGTDSKEQCMDLCLIQIAQEYEEVFTQETRRKVRQYGENLKNKKVADGRFLFPFVNQGNLQYVSAEYLKKYHKAVACEEEGSWKQAFDLYSELMPTLNSSHINVKVIEMAVKTEQYAEALRLLYKHF